MAEKSQRMVRVDNAFFRIPALKITIAMTR